MQDTETGEMIPLKENTQEAKDAAIPERNRQGAVFTKGETLEIRGGKFRVASIGMRMLMLEAMPGVRIEGAPEESRGAGDAARHDLREFHQALGEAGRWEGGNPA